MATAGVHLTTCMWMVVSAAILTPLTWFGTPKDFWPIAVGALITTVTACVLIMVNVGMEGAKLEAVEYPPASASGFFQGIFLNLYILDIIKLVTIYKCMTNWF